MFVWPTRKNLRPLEYSPRQHEIVVLDDPSLEELLIRICRKNGESTQCAGRARKWIKLARKANLLKQVLADFGISGRVENRMFGGKRYVILRGYPGLRKYLRGTKYLSTNPRVVQFHTGRGSLGGRLRIHTIFTVVLVAGTVTADALLGVIPPEDVTFVLGTELTKSGISILAAELTGLLLAGTGVAVLPVAGAMIVGIGVGLLLDYLDNRYGISEQVIAAMHDAWETVQEKLEEIEWPVIQYMESFKRWMICPFPAARSPGCDVLNLLR